MNVANLVETLERRNIELSVTEQGKLRIVSDQDFMKTTEFAQLKDHKAEVVCLLNHRLAESLIGSLKLCDDRNFVLEELQDIYGSERLSIVQEYLHQWQTGYDSVPAFHIRENAGRYRANVWLRNRNKQMVKR